MFVNNVRVQFKMLNDGNRITLGGVLKSYQEGSQFPASHTARPHLVYEYRIVKDHSLPGVYQEPTFGNDELIRFEDFVGGRFVKEVYHTEDFNETLVQHIFVLIDYCIAFQVNVVDSLLTGSDVPTEVVLLLVHGSSFGCMSFLPPPVTHMGTSGSRIQAYWAQVCRLNH